MARQKAGARWYRVRLAMQRLLLGVPWAPTRIVEHFGRIMARGYVPDTLIAPRGRR